MGETLFYWFPLYFVFRMLQVKTDNLCMHIHHLPALRKLTLALIYLVSEVPFIAYPSVFCFHYIFFF